MMSRWKGIGIWAGLGLMAFCAFVLALYFLLTSTRIAQALEVALNDDLAPGVISLEGIQVGPSPGEMHVVGLSITGMDGQPIVDITHLEGRLSLSTMLFGDASGWEIESLLADGFHLDLQWTEEGRFLFTETFKGRSKSLKPKKKKLLPEMWLKSVVLKNGTLSVGTEAQGATLDALSLEGMIAMGPNRFDLDAGLQSNGGFLWRQSKTKEGDDSRWVYPLKETRVDGFTMKKGGFRAQELEITSQDGRISLSPDVVMGSKSSVEIGFQLACPESLLSVLTDEKVVADIKSAGKFYWKGSSLRLEVAELASSRAKVGKTSIWGLTSHGKVVLEPEGLELSVELESNGAKWKDVEFANPGIQLFVDGEMTVAQRNALIQASRKGIIQLWGALGEIGRLRIQLGPSAVRSIKSKDWFVRGLRTRRVQLLYGATGANEFSLDLGRPESDEDRGIYADAVVLGEAKVFLPGLKGRIDGKAALFGNASTEGLRVTSSLGTSRVDAEVKMGIRGANLRATLELSDGDLRSLKPSLQDSTWEQLGVLKEGKIQGRMVLDGDLLKKRLPALTSASLKVEREGTSPLHLKSGAGKQGPDAVLGPWKFQRDEGGR